MNTYSETSRRRLYRDADRAVLGGVCAGLAGHFGLNLKVTRLLAVIAFFMAMPMALIAYLAIVFLVPAESHRDYGREYESVEVTRCCWGMRRARRRRKPRDKHDSVATRERPTKPAAPSLDDVRKRYQSLDERLAELERQVTSPRYQLEQEFRKL
ncbi:MAG: PspC domain-containing protein [Woeseiaceae bacterium]